MAPKKPAASRAPREGQWTAGLTPQPIAGPARSNVNAPNFPHLNPQGYTEMFRDGFGNPHAAGHAAPKGPDRPGPNATAAADRAAAANAHVERTRDEEDGLVQGDTFADYVPTKLDIGVRHPDRIVETTSLRSVPPPDVKYKLKLPQQLIDNGLLSALQLEAVVYACQQHATFLGDGKRAGFLVGDGAGVGKGRTIAGLIYENYLRGRKKAIWISISADLKVDAVRDLTDIGADCIEVHRLEKQKYVPLPFKSGVLFATYSALVGKSGGTKGNNPKTRLEQIIAWCGKEFDGVIVFDESHKAKNLYTTGKMESTKSGMAVRDLQERLPSARILYASATGATEPRNMGYMSRLGLWGEYTEFENFRAFDKSIEKRGVGAMELVAMEMKHRGMYIARQLSFQGVSFNIVEVLLKDDFVVLYDKCVDFWEKAEGSFRDALVISKAGRKRNFVVLTQFWGAHQRFFKYLCLSAKIEAAVEWAQKAVEEGKCAVIGLQSTGEAKTDQLREKLEAAGEELTDFISTSRAVFMSLMNLYPVDIDTDGGRRGVFLDDGDSGNDESGSGLDDDLLQEEMEMLAEQGLDPNLARTPRQQIRQTLVANKDELMDQFEEFGDELPLNMLDTLVDLLGGPSKVAEMTGRKGRMICDENGHIQYEERKNLDDTDSLNIAEKEKFMKGSKLIAIISEAASSGISLQADRRVKNQRRRVHITLELAWSADRAIQQFGRTHRSNQVSAPEYVFLISDVAGEKRFASVVARRLERLGALTHGDRRVTETRDLSMFNVDTKFGKQALRTTMRVLTREYPCPVPLPVYPNGDFMTDMRRAMTSCGMLMLVVSAAGMESLKEPGSTGITMDRFMNRILGMRVGMQNLLFQFFVDILDYVIAEAQKEGKFDLGAMELGKPDSPARLMKRVRFTLVNKEHSAVYVTTVMTDRGIAFDAAQQILAKFVPPAGNERAGSDNGYYRSSGTSGRPFILLAVLRVGAKGFSSRNSRMFDIYRPNTGHAVSQIPWSDLNIKNEKIANEHTARTLWTVMYDSTTNQCLHMYLHGTCSTRNRDGECIHGMHRRTSYVLNGSVLGIWRQLEGMFCAEATGKMIRMQIVRIIFEECRVIGVQLPYRTYSLIMDALRNSLGKEVEDTHLFVAQMAREAEFNRRHAVTMGVAPRPSMAAGSMMSSAAKKRNETASQGASQKTGDRGRARSPSSESEGAVSLDSSSSAESDADDERSKRRDVKQVIKNAKKRSVSSRNSSNLSGLSHSSKEKTSSPSSSRGRKIAEEISLLSSDEDTKPVIAKRKKPAPAGGDFDIIILSSDDESSKPAPISRPKLLIKKKSQSSDEDMPVSRMTKAPVKCDPLLSSNDDLPPIRPKPSVPKKKILRLFTSSEEDEKAEPPKQEVKPVVKAIARPASPGPSRVPDSVKTANSPLKLKTKSGLGGGMYPVKSIPIVCLEISDDESPPVMVAKKEPSSQGSISSPLKTLNVDLGTRVNSAKYEKMDVDEEDTFRSSQNSYEQLSQDMKRMLSTDEPKSMEF